MEIVVSGAEPGVGGQNEFSVPTKLRLGVSKFHVQNENEMKLRLPGLAQFSSSWVPSEDRGCHIIECSIHPRNLFTLEPIISFKSSSIQEPH